MANRRARAALAVILALAGLPLAGCGFKPMYATQAGGSSVAVTLAGIAVAEQNSRPGQLVRNALLDRIAPVGQGQPERYRLDFSLAESDFDISIERNTDVNRMSYTLTVAYRLVDLSTGASILSGETFSRVSYDRVPSEFANLQAHRNAVERAALEVADNIQIRLGAFFSQ
ncbi:LPS assembly lipoprotein LptE [Rhodoligotrophos ferricapiens]|uniref:LPS assembly lipoprotein LptE n=1 Tax=Rhodoligotrophos ferricapiens TaxID=3069264 RepID=UPI00315C9EB8